MDSATAASALYGTPAPAAAPAPAPAPEPAADALFVTDVDGKAVPDQRIAEGQAESDTAVKLHGSTLRAVEEAALDRFGLSSADAAESSASWGQTFVEWDVPPDQAGQLVEAAVGALAGHVTAEQVQSWNTDARAELKQQYGAQADAVLAHANSMIKRDPALSSWLRTTGMGSHPKIVAIAAARAWASMRAKR